MWQNFVHLSIVENNEVHRDEFRFIRAKDNKDVTEHVGLGNQNKSS